MTEQSPEEIHLKHIRAPDYKEISADGTLHKIVDNHLVITFYIEDSRVTGEVLRRDGQDPPTYRIAAIEEEKQRLDVVAVRVPTKAILGLAAAVAERLTQLPPGGGKIREEVSCRRDPLRGWLAATPCRSVKSPDLRQIKTHALRRRYGKGPWEKSCPRLRNKCQACGKKCRNTMGLLRL